MVRQETLNTLIDLARNDADEAAGQLRQLAAERHEAQQQLDMLRDYRLDYAERLQKAMHTGLSASNYHNFRQFIATLDEAISQQNKAVAQIDAKIDAGRGRWQAEQRKLNSYETLQSRQLRQRAVLENRREQRANDDISASRPRRASHSY